MPDAALSVKNEGMKLVRFPLFWLYFTQRRYRVNMMLNKTRILQWENWYQEESQRQLYEKPESRCSDSTGLPKGTWEIPGSIRNQWCWVLWGVVNNGGIAGDPSNPRVIKNWKTGGWRDGHTVKSTFCTLTGSSHYNCSIRESNALFWFPWGTAHM